MKKSIFTLALALVALVASAQIKKPELMVIPSDVWCITNGYYTEVENMGTTVKVPNYKQALQENMGLKMAIAKLNDLMAERQFPLQSLEQTIKNLEQRRMEDNMTISKAGNELAESPLDEVARTAKCDIILELSWEVKDFGPKHSLAYILEARDAYTSKSIGAASGTGAPSLSADVDVLLEEAIVANMDNFNNRLMDHFSEMQTIGREVSLDIKVFANNAAGIDLETEYNGEELIDIINNWLQVNTIQGRFSMPYASENVANFTQVRIPVYDERGRAIDANGFAKQLTKMLKKEPYNIPAKVLVKGLGRAVIILGEK
ncbi:MAG: hypothetical protein J5902_02490 [Paludibacteraceae bacterium]|nr:hypothetical protein [Paludibacteraceae bacterium]MBQ9297380.1 hypothetical protein [Paludibacteraceae bacterium]